MRIHLTVWTLLLPLGLAGCSEEARESSEQKDRPLGLSSPQPVNTGGRQVISVCSSEEFVKAVGPDRVIKLAPGEYNLSGLKQRYMDYVRWVQATDGYDLIIRKVRDLRIEGPADTRARLVASPSYVYVLGFEDVAGLELVNLELAHSPKLGYCTGGVVLVNRGKRVTIRNCVLAGSGMEGLTLSKVRGLTFERSVIKECTYGIMTITDCRDLLFKNSRFANNEEWHGITIKDSLGVRFERCRIEKNLAKGSFEGVGSLFEVTSSSDVEVVGGAIRENRFVRLLRPPGSVEFHNVTIADNMEVKTDE